jgi:hypothetical protein
MEAKYQEYLISLQKPIYNIVPRVADFISDVKFQDPNQLLAFSRNDFPYDIPDVQEHWILWVKNNGKSNTSLFLEFIYFYIASSFSKNKVFAIWQNEPEKQSVKDLTHFHFILLD